MQRKLVQIGGWLGVSGLVTGIASIFVPWVQQLVVTGSGRRAQQRLDSLTILNLEKGLWYVILLLTLVAILGAAALGANQGRKFAGLAGPILSLVTASLVVGLITTFDGQLTGAGRIADVGTSAGSWLALAAMPLLGFACGLLAIGRAGRHVSAPSGVAAGHD
ncbi:hypothetical protein AB0H83_28085 [Dactylosporangium sp. NPDC050688]|uniref:hypothetical protein n=1 Tax=Dactylosporangium sp. NPDC050688 TaxID=3157217 RepID=UPI0033DAEDC4